MSATAVEKITHLPDKRPLSARTPHPRKGTSLRIRIIKAWPYESESLA
jgi:hypothetical protein